MFGPGAWLTRTLIGSPPLAEWQTTSPYRRGYIAQPARIHSQTGASPDNHLVAIDAGNALAMTLLITLGRESAIHQSSDYRLSYQGNVKETANGTKQLTLSARACLDRNNRIHRDRNRRQRLQYQGLAPGSERVSVTDLAGNTYTKETAAPGDGLILNACPDCPRVSAEIAAGFLLRDVAE
jgi:hypothetical protein